MLLLRRGGIREATGIRRAALRATYGVLDQTDRTHGYRLVWGRKTVTLVTFAIPKVVETASSET